MVEDGYVWQQEEGSQLKVAGVSRELEVVGK